MADPIFCTWAEVIWNSSLRRSAAPSRFLARLGQAAAAWSGPDGPGVIGRAVERARAVADLDTILENSRY
ncbi:MAG TPA: hypothetical protein VGI96_22335 [Streptosporangiaceae bacterium]|jgi:hypothetical protein